MLVFMFGFYWKKSMKWVVICVLLSGLGCWCYFFLYFSLLLSYYFNLLLSDVEFGLGFVFFLLVNCIMFIVIVLFF